MTDYAELVRRLRSYATERYLGACCPNLVHEAADAILELVTDLADARAALRDPDLMRGLFGAANGQAAQRWASFHADAIAAAQAEKEVSDE